MTNAAIYFHPDGYETNRPKLMGRHAAGESFLRGFIRHAKVDRLDLFNAGVTTPDDLQPLLRRIEPTALPQRWLARNERHRLNDPGCFYLPQPTLAPEAWLRAPFGAAHYSLCGLTHTIATQRTMDVLADMMSAPVQSWDALICTSDAVRSSVRTQLDAVRADLTERLGATRFPDPQLVTIPLGVNASDFAPQPAHRQAWRRRLGIPDDEVVALYVGRYHANGKMNPATMALALESAAQSLDKPLHWIVAGWSATAETTELFHAQTRAFCPSVRYHPVDGRQPDARFAIWSAADFFVSFSDNVQETFGLTPVEAMAAGLPAVVTDWDGYRDTVRHGLDGFRIATMSPAKGLGRDLAYYHANDWVGYESYVGAAAQLTAHDHAAAVDAIVALARQPDLRARMGASARARANDYFDWSAIIPRYQALWRELAARRARAGGEPASQRRYDNPRRLDPFEMFASYPTDVLAADTPLALTSGLEWPVLEARLSQPLATISAWALPTVVEVRAIYDHLLRAGPSTAEDLVASAQPNRRPFLQRGLLWLVKFGVLSLSAPPIVPQDRETTETSAPSDRI